MCGLLVHEDLLVFIFNTECLTNDLCSLTRQLNRQQVIIQIRVRLPAGRTNNLHVHRILLTLVVDNREVRQPEVLVAGLEEVRHSSTLTQSLLLGKRLCVSSVTPSDVAHS